MDYSLFKNLICEKFKQYVGIILSDEQCLSFYTYMNMLIEKNKVMNLTAITEPEEVVIRHFVDSAMAVKFYNDILSDKKYTVDVGTGAGFPGLPLAIISPNSSFVLNDTLGKRINFLSEVISELNIKNVELVKSRAEDFGHDKKYREKFDYAVSRGVSKLSVLSEYSLPLVNVGGAMLAYKMFDCDDELASGNNAIKKLGGKFHVKHKYSIIDNEPDRCVVEIKKTSNTPTKFPRKAGTPSSNPL